MSIYEYDQERHMRQEREQSYEKGHAQGFTDGQRSMAVNLARSGMSAEEIAQIAETDVGLVREWIRGQI